jgi:hypothetical protein
MNQPKPELPHRPPASEEQAPEPGTELRIEPVEERSAPGLVQVTPTIDINWE